jgi:mannose-1-phosphate guanylyltransferase / mannose-6-phosphate isomerase
MSGVSMRPRRQALVLAGGRGTRLQRITRALGEPAEKQFCHFGGDRTLVQATVERLEELVDGTTVVVRTDQLPIAVTQLGARRAIEIVAQPSDRGTGIGVLVGLLCAYRAASTSTIILAPADHGFADEETLRDALRQAAALAERTRRIVLVWVDPDAPRSDYGWILPRGEGAARAVTRFVEKPPVAEARLLREAGGLFNTMMLAAPIDELVRLFSQVSPRTLAELLPAAALSAAQRDAFLRNSFGSVPYLDFSRDLIASACDLRVVTLPQSAGWTDLGDERRVLTWLERRGPGAALGRVRAVCGRGPRKVAVSTESADTVA